MDKHISDIQPSEPKFNDRGEEIMDPMPIAAALDFAAPSHNDVIRQIIQQELSKYAMDNGEESFEEADDFDVGDDFDPRSPYELDHLPLDEEYPVDPPAKGPEPKSEQEAPKEPVSQPSPPPAS